MFVNGDGDALGSGQDYELRALPANRDDAATRPVSADEVLLRAFQRLLGLPARTP